MLVLHNFSQSKWKQEFPLFPIQSPLWGKFIYKWDLYKLSAGSKELVCQKKSCCQTQFFLLRSPPKLRHSTIRLGLAKYIFYIFQFSWMETRNTIISPKIYIYNPEISIYIFFKVSFATKGKTLQNKKENIFFWVLPVARKRERGVSSLIWSTQLGCTNSVDS